MENDIPKGKETRYYRILIFHIDNCFDCPGLIEEENLELEDTYNIVCQNMDNDHVIVSGIKEGTKFRGRLYPPDRCPLPKKEIP